MDLYIKQENWDELKSKLKINYPLLTDEDLKHDEGMEESMLRMVAYKLRKSKKEMKEIIEGIGYLSF